MRRIAGLAGASRDCPGQRQRVNKGAGQQWFGQQRQREIAGGPSAGYGGKVSAKVRPNIGGMYPEAISGNPRAEARGKVPDGTRMAPSPGGD